MSGGTDWMPLMKTKSKKILLDTNLLIGILHNDPRAIELIRRLRKSYELPYVSVMTHIELDVGVYTDEQKQAAQSLLESVRCQDLTQEIAVGVSRLLQPFTKDKQRKSHLLPDAIIAATANHLEADICTANIEDFRALAVQNDQIVEYHPVKKK